MSTIEKLAEYFTGPAVAHNSIALQVGGRSKAIAEEFFAIRGALGIKGYADKEEAAVCIGMLLKEKGRG